MTPRLPICHIVWGCSPRVANFVGRLAAWFGEGADNVGGFLVGEMSPPSMARAVRGGYQFLKAPTPRVLSVRRTLRDLLQLCSGRGIGLIHAHGANSLDAGARLAEALHVPLVVSAYDLRDASLFSRRKRFPRQTTTVTEVREGLLPDTGLRPAVVPPGIDRREYLEGVNAEQVMRMMALDPERPRIGFVSEFEDERCGGEVFVRAVAELARTIATIEFVVVGEGAYLAEVQKLAHELECYGYFSFLPFRADVARIYAILDLVVAPALETAFPWSLVEGYAAHVPIVASDIPAHRQILSEENGARFITPGDPHLLAETIAREIGGLPSDREWDGFLEIEQQEGQAPKLVRGGVPRIAYDISGDRLRPVEVTSNPAEARREKILERYSLSSAADAFGEIYEEAWKAAGVA